MNSHIRISMNSLDLIDQGFGHVMSSLKIVLAPDLDMKIQEHLIADHPTAQIMNADNRWMMPEDEHLDRLKLGVREPTV